MRGMEVKQDTQSINTGRTRCSHSVTYRQQTDISTCNGLFGKEVTGNIHRLCDRGRFSSSLVHSEGEHIDNSWL